jgi:hypothetical protein
VVWRWKGSVEHNFSEPLHGWVHELNVKPDN